MMHTIISLDDIFMTSDYLTNEPDVSDVSEAQRHYIPPELICFNPTRFLGGASPQSSPRTSPASN